MARTKLSRSSCLRGVMGRMPLMSLPMPSNLQILRDLMLFSSIPPVDGTMTKLLWAVSARQIPFLVRLTIVR